MKKNIAKIALMALLISPFGIAHLTKAVTPPNWNTTGSYVVAFNYQSVNYAHDMSLTQDGLGNLTGSGGNPAGGSYVYTWVLTSGSVSGNTIDFMANYTAGADAVTPQTTMHVTGTIALNGTMSGTWSDNYQGGSRTGTWATTSGMATAITNNVMTNPATAVTMNNATLNGTNGNSSATGHSFWVSLNTFSTTSPTIPAGVYSTPDFGAIAANAPFSASLSSITTTGIPTNLPTILPNTTYYFAAWSLVGGTWYPGQVLTFTTGKNGGNGGGGDRNENEGMENGNDHGGNVISGGEDSHVNNNQGSSDQGNTNQGSSSGGHGERNNTGQGSSSSNNDHGNSSQGNGNHSNHNQGKDS